MENDRAFVCQDCGKKFDRKYNLQRHENRVHMKEIRKIRETPSIFANKFICNKCDRSFSSDSNLRRHERGTHIHENPQVFICDVCEKSCRNRTEFEQHWKSNHAVKVFSLQRCPICKIDVISGEILDHFAQEHKMNIQIQEYSFPNENTFLEWKKKIEGESYSRFIVHYKKHNTTNYICHRSGYYQSHSKGIRRLKTQGSKKINGFCPASIRVKKSGAELQVRFISNHVHVGSKKEDEICHLSISRTKKEEIARKMNVPLVSEEESAKISAINSEIRVKRQRETVTRKSLNQRYLKIIKNIRTNSGRLLLMKCLEKVEKKIGILERRTSAVVKNITKQRDRLRGKK